MRSQQVIHVDHDDIRVRGEKSAPRIVLLAVPDDETTSVDVHVHRGPVFAGRRVIDRGRDIAVTSRNLDQCCAAGDFGEPDAAHRPGSHSYGEQAGQGIGQHRCGQYRHVFLRMSGQFNWFN